MKHIDKKLVGITIVGLSAWALVIVLVFNNSTTMAMLTYDPSPSGEQVEAANTDAQPRTLGASSEDGTALRATSESSAPDTGEVQGASITQAPAASVAAVGGQDLSGELETSTNRKPSKFLIPIAVVSGIFLLMGAALWVFASRQKSPTAE